MLLGLTGSLLLGLAVSGGGAEVGEKVGPFHFTDTRYLQRSLDDLGEPKAFVVAFTSLDCPVARRVMPRLAEMEKADRARGVQYLAIDVGPSDLVVDVAARAVEQGLEFPVGRDLDGSVVAALHATRTPEIVVLDAQRRIRYRGRIDASERLAMKSPAPARADLREAIEDVLAGRAVSVAETPVDGCRIASPAPGAGAAAPTWEGVVGGIVSRNCVACHAAGGSAPFALASYGQAAAHAETIAEVVALGRMPPWFACSGCGEFENRRGLSPDERAAVVAWVRAGAPRGSAVVPAGNPDAAPAAPAAAEPRPAWRIGEPDLVVTMAAAVKLPATGYVPYKYIVLPRLFTEDTWVQSVEIRPSNRRALHHANLGFYQVGEDVKTANFITGQVPGGDPMDLDEGVAVLIPKGSLLGLQIHYVTTGREEEDRISVGLRYPRTPVQKRLRHHEIAQFRFEIPPFAPAFPVSAERAFEADSIGIGMFVHMHLRGRDMRYTAHYPDGRDETLLFVPNYSFDWQTAYRWKKGAQEFPKGTKVECLAHFDNSRFNPWNPDPSKAVRFGQETFDEMMYGFLFYVQKDEALGIEVDPESGHALAR